MRDECLLKLDFYSSILGRVKTNHSNLKKKRNILSNPPIFKMLVIISKTQLPPQQKAIQDPFSSHLNLGEKVLQGGIKSI